MTTRYDLGKKEAAALPAPVLTQDQLHALSMLLLVAPAAGAALAAPDGEGFTGAMTTGLGSGAGQVAGSLAGVRISGDRAQAYDEIKKNVRRGKKTDVPDLTGRLVRGRGGVTGLVAGGLGGAALGYGANKLLHKTIGALPDQTTDSAEPERDYIVGAEKAAAQFGLPAPVPGTYADVQREDEQRPKKTRSWLPAALGAAAAGGLGFYALRQRKLLPGAWGKIQEQAGEHGFHRVVDVPYADQLKKLHDPEDSWFERLVQHHQPVVDPQTHEMSAWNKAKFWMLEGEHAIPVATRGKDIRAVGHPGGVAKVHDQAYVYGRHIRPTGAGEHGVSPASVVLGGHDVEGPLKTQQALTHLSQQGKGFEAELLNKHAPGATPETRGGHHFISPDASAGGDPVSRARAFKQSVDRHFGGEYMMKPTLGLSSGGQFPNHQQDWGNLISKYHQHLASNPEVANFVRNTPPSAMSNELVDYLKAHSLYEGYTLDQATKNPRNVIIQRKIPNFDYEYRVHTHLGQVLPDGNIPRFIAPHLVGDAFPDIRKKKWDAITKYTQGVLDKLPEEYRNGTYGMDVAISRDPKSGKVRHHIIEMNPAERADAHLEGGGTGALDYVTVPWAAHTHNRAMTGQWTQPAAMAGGLGAAALAGTAAYGLTPREVQEDDDTPHPVG